MIYTDGVHMISDTNLNDLHLFAESIGLNKCWFDSNKKHPHYDLMKSKKNRKIVLQKAIENGAKLISSKELVLIIKK